MTLQKFLLQCFAICLLFISHLTLAQQTNPLAADPRAAYAGGVIFRAQCATCHGADGKGIESINAPDLTQMWVNRELGDSEVFATIRTGVPGSIMPPHGFPDPEIWMLVSYLKSIAIAGTTRTLTGDSGRGQELFAANCARCHRAAGQGGSLGPELTRITTRRSYEALIESIRNPSASIGNNYKPVRLTDAGGKQFVGTLKSEDAFSLQIMDSDQQLRGFAKNQLRQFSRDTQSLMPVFSAADLSANNIDDILTFLQARP